MRLAADPAAERWLVGLTGAEQEFEWDVGNLTNAAGRRLALIFTRRGNRLRAISCRAMHRKERALYEEARRQED